MNKYNRALRASAVGQIDYEIIVIARSFRATKQSSLYFLVLRRVRNAAE
jgi:hypothetical protein